MRKNLLRRKEKAPRQERILSEVDRLICWEDLARCAEPCLDETSQITKVERGSLECLVRMAVLNRCFGISPTDISAMPWQDTQALPGQEDLDRFFQLISGCSLRGRIMRELDAQLSKVGVSLGRQAAGALV